MFTRFFPPKWRLRIFVLEAIMLSISLVHFAQFFNKATKPETENNILAEDGSIDTKKFITRTNEEVVQIDTEKLGAMINDAADTIATSKNNQESNN